MAKLHNVTLFSLALLFSLNAHAEIALTGTGDRLLATGGVMQIEGSAGGGLTPWALISGYGTREQVGGAAFYTRAKTQDDFDMDLAGFAVGFNNRLELSYGFNRFGLGKTVPNEHIRLHTLGAKVRLFGDAVYDQDSWLPQVSAGVQFKHNEDFDFIPKAIGAKKPQALTFIFQRLSFI